MDIQSSKKKFESRADLYQQYSNLVKFGSPFGKPLEDPALLEIKHIYKPKFSLNAEQGYFVRERKRKQIRTINEVFNESKKKASVHRLHAQEGSDGSLSPLRRK